jgi:hypothetical protein
MAPGRVEPAHADSKPARQDAHLQGKPAEDWGLGATVRATRVEVDEDRRVRALAGVLAFIPSQLKGFPGARPGVGEVDVDVRRTLADATRRWNPPSR